MRLNAPNFAPDVPPIDDTAEYSEHWCVCAKSCNCSRVREPMPRAGKFTTRENEVSSCGLSIRRKYASACLISARSKNRKPPYTRYGMPALNNACSIKRDCAFARYSTAISLRAIPLAICARISSTTNADSVKSDSASYTRTDSPCPRSVHNSLPRRLLLPRISALAAPKMWP